ncbi:hypothetical protein [Cohnella rhizosphaerae]|uniref:Uncharacterized protein n=1 Tax=Cohnella rhizosphaerae TaxID=1457232 RepID=A0A9X4L0R8_9BACL|nr:hypothetical protein [Cohnella rhizosphaerae]MDG0811374.1 hypothetical protein [Cohnella rhizosphaerae]
MFNEDAQIGKLRRVDRRVLQRQHQRDRAALQIRFDFHRSADQGDMLAAGCLLLRFRTLLDFIAFGFLF